MFYDGPSMKGINESIFMSSLRAFLSALFWILGAALAVLLIILIIAGISSAREDDKLSSKVKIFPDANSSRKKLSSDIPILLQVTIDGTIGEDKLTGKHIAKMLLESREDGFKSDRVKGIFLVVNSPGGGVTDSDIIYRHLKVYKETFNVPIFAYVDGLCASGGYYIACAADQIFASDVSIIGSIGVLSWPPFMNLYDALEKLGINAMTLSAGNGKDEMNPFRPWKPDEQDQYQSLINYFYQRFVGIVAEDRSIPENDLVNQIGAKIFPAPKAKEIGLIDHSGATRESALKALAKAAGVEKEYQVVGFKTKAWWKKLFVEQSSSPLFTGKIKHELSLPSQQSIPFGYIYKN